MKKYLFLFVSISLIFISIQPAVSAEQKHLTFNQVFNDNGEELLNPGIRVLNWYKDTIYFSRQGGIFKSGVENFKPIAVLNNPSHPGLSSKGIDALSYVDSTPDFSKLIYLHEGDIFLYYTKEKLLVQITTTEGKEKNPSFSPNGSKIAYTLDNDLYYYDINKRESFRMTNDGSDTILNGYASWIYYEEVLGRSSNYKAFWWSPDSNKISFLKFDQSGMKIFTLARYSGDYGYIEQAYYPKPGYPNPKVRVGIADTVKKDVSIVPFEKEEDHYLSFPFWKNMNELYFQVMTRNQEDLELYSYSIPENKITPVYKEHQKTWVRLLEDYLLKPLSDGSFLLVSDKSGWAHIYHVKDENNIRQLTSGKWAVGEIHKVDESNGLVYFSAYKESNTAYDFYSLEMKSGKIKRITENNGRNSITLSENGEYFVNSFQNLETPTAVTLNKINGEKVFTINDRFNPAMNEYALPEFHLDEFTTTDGTQLPFIWITPSDFNPEKKYPVVLRVYGGPEVASVRQSFMNRRELRKVYQYYAEQNIIMAWIDHRGSGQHGKAGANLMYRKLGKIELDDYREFIDYFRGKPFVDKNKFGITGGSYGGYISILANLKYPEYFPYAYATASVTDWRWYDSLWTERFMDTPLENPDGYKYSSVFRYMDNYKGGLSLNHGTIDDNVHPQHTYQFIEKMISDGHYFEFMLYPGDRHVFRSNVRLYNMQRELDFWLRMFYGKTLDEVRKQER